MTKRGRGERNEHEFMLDYVRSKRRKSLSIGTRPAWTVDCERYEMRPEIPPFDFPFPCYAVGIPVALAAARRDWMATSRVAGFQQLRVKSAHVAIFCTIDELMEILGRLVQTNRAEWFNSVRRVGECAADLGLQDEARFHRRVRYTCVESVSDVFRTLPVGFRFVAVDDQHALCPAGEKRRLQRWIKKVTE